ncbi:hypothetical protein HYFRA_00011658 [Hymenoscyphus fraxineus]|uniref:Integral membrane protein n=1 Tax=Hymenoscyphus fraxineus TaxID=746836 RepID=A0A9N9PJG5_9HELO|nr:hypothetical protein HYFRA_00011658 [Hymenoscyphus fraxineus]
MKSEADSNGGQSPGTQTTFVDSLDHGERFSNWPNFSIEQYYPRHTRGNSIQKILFPDPSFTTRPGLSRSLKLMCTKYPVRDMAWATGIFFALGSLLFVINGFFIVLPLVAPNLNFPTEASYGGPVTALAGGILFCFGGLAGYLEGLNAKRAGGPQMTEGIRVDREICSMEDGLKTRDDDELALRASASSDNISQRTTPPTTPRPTSSCPYATSILHPITTTDGITTIVRASATNRNLTANATKPPHLAMIGSPTFIWIPSLRQFTHTYMRDLTFMGCLIQFIGTFIFLFAIVTGLPGLMDLTSVPTLFLWNLLPATLGGVLFITASMCQLLSSQDKWYRPKPLDLEWHIGVSNVIGSIGFTLAGALPFLQTPNGTLQASLASLWGSWAYLVGSILQWYCAMGKYASD